MDELALDGQAKSLGAYCSQTSTQVRLSVTMETSHQSNNKTVMKRWDRKNLNSQGFYWNRRAEEAVEGGSKRRGSKRGGVNYIKS